MKPEHRQKEIISLLRAMQTEVRVEELARRLGVSGLTIRRDLSELAGKGAIIRTHGGGIAPGRAALETGYHRKAAQNFALKQAIGRAAAAEALPGQVLLINDGSTTYHVAAHLEGRGPLTVYTNSLAMLTDLSRARDVSVYILGGRYDPDLYSLQGSLAERVLETLKIDLCFLGADAVGRDGECLVATPEEASLTRTMLRRAGRRVLLADHTKVEAGRSGAAYGSLADFHLWITTPGIDPAVLDALGRYVTIKEATA